MRTAKAEQTKALEYKRLRLVQQASLRTPGANECTLATSSCARNLGAINGCRNWQHRAPARYTMNGNAAILTCHRQRERITDWGTRPAAGMHQVSRSPRGTVKTKKRVPFPGGMVAVVRVTFCPAPASLSSQTTGRQSISFNRP